MFVMDYEVVAKKHFLVSVQMASLVKTSIHPFLMRNNYFHILPKGVPEIAQAKYNIHNCHNFNLIPVMYVLLMEPFQPYCKINIFLSLISG